MYVSFGYVGIHSLHISFLLYFELFRDPHNIGTPRIAITEKDRINRERKSVSL